MAVAFDNIVKSHNTTGNSTDETQSIASSAAALAIDLTQGRNVLITLGASVTSWTMTGGQAGQFYTLTFIQDATGSRTLASAQATVIYLPTVYVATGTRTAPTLTTTAAKRDSFLFYFDGLNYWEIQRAFNN